MAEQPHSSVTTTMVEHWLTANPQRRIVVSAKYDGDIREEDVVRPSNHKYATLAEARTFEHKSTAHCPTYGSCCMCYKSGPVGMDCDCPRQGLYMVVFYGKGRVVDSISIAEIMGAGHQVARGNLTWGWIRTPSMGLSYDIVGLVLGRKYEQTEGHAAVLTRLHQVFALVEGEHMLPY